MNRRSFATWTLPGKRRNVRSASGSGETSRGPAAMIPLSRPSARSASILPTRVVSSISPEMVSRTYPPASTKTSVGQERTAKRSQMSCSESTTTGWVTPLRSTARLTFCGSFSEMNLAEWTPMTTTGSFAKRSSTRRSTGRTCMQLMQQYVQKSSTATRPRRSPATLRGRRALIQVNPGRNSGQRTRAVGMRGIYTRVRGKKRQFAARAGTKRLAAPSAQGLLDFRGQPLGLALVAQRGRYRDGQAGRARDLQIVIGCHADLHADLQRDVADLGGSAPYGPRHAVKVVRVPA